jgi:4-hydroxy-L-threonine phosphate dehydrogenase PdxA
VIYVTQGHEKSIGLEVFIKSILSLSQHKDITLIASKKSLTDTLKSISISSEFTSGFLILEGFKVINYIEPNLEENTQTMACLLKAIELANSKDILLTLPSSKDQFIYKGIQLNGHTEFFRNYYNNLDLCMFFQRKQSNYLLLSDHIPLKQVCSYITPQLIYNKVKTVLSYYHSFKDVHFAGVNPHAGEGGLLGNEEINFLDPIDKLREEFSNINFYAPTSGDTLAFIESQASLLVYSYHDQALSCFKGVHQLLGANITLGLPFLRYSVDHGTAFDLYGKGCANYMGCLEILRKI